MSLRDLFRSRRGESPPAGPGLMLVERDFDFEAEDGSLVDGLGYLLEGTDGAQLRYSGRSLGEYGACVVNVAGISFRLKNVQGGEFAPGRRLRLVPEPRNKRDRNAVAVWDYRKRRQAGYVPRESCADIARRLNGGEALEAYSVWEWRDEDGQRCGLRVLIAPAGTVRHRPRVLS